VPIVLKSGSLNLLDTSGPVKASNGIALPLLLYHYIVDFANIREIGDFLSPQNACTERDLKTLAR
jgi:hypothetical protein